MGRCLAAVGLSLLMFAGCGGGGDSPKTAKVSGTVTVDGQPMAGVEVHFLHDKFKGYGKTDASGKYSLVGGAIAGENKVYFSKIEGGDIKVDPESGIDETQLQMMAEASGGKGPKVAKQLIPAEYADPAQTKVTFMVPDGGSTSADFDIKTK